LEARRFHSCTADRVTPIEALTASQFDLAIVGGGITGAALAYLASVSGLSVVLVEQQDFATGASSASQKIIHSGLRYLQHGRLGRTIESIDDRVRLAWLAPHLVRPLPCALPLYGATAPARLGARIYRTLLSSRPAPPPGRDGITPPRVVPPAEILDRIPELPRDGLRGALVWEDAQVFDSERLVLAFVRSAIARGALAVNYTRADGLESDNGRVTGLRVSRADGDSFTVRAHHVVDCSGQWNFLATAANTRPSRYVFGLNIVTPPVSASTFAFGLPARGERGTPTWFVTPWRGHSIIGTLWSDTIGEPPDRSRNSSAVATLVDGFNRSFAGRAITIEDVRIVLGARVPAHEGAGRKAAATLERTRVVDHAAHGMAGAFTVLAPKLTTALTSASQVMSRLVPGYRMPSTGELPRLVGGDIDNWAQFSDHWTARGVPLEVIQGYGDETARIVKGNAPSLGLMVRHAVEHELATNLPDVVLRRCVLAATGPPARTTVAAAAEEMAACLGWDDTERRRQVDSLARGFQGP